MTRLIRYQGAIVRDHHILLIKQTEHASGRSYWLIPGGGIEPDETEESCVQREMQEETCLHVEIRCLLLDDPSSPGGTYQRWKTYLCHVLDGEPRPGYEPEEECAAAYALTDVGWFDLRHPTSWNEQVLSDRITYPLLQRIRTALGYAVPGETGARPPQGGGAVSLPDDPTAVQLRLIHELTSVLQEAGIPHWLFGGWVVDFLAGEVTRPHSDIDLLIWSRDAPAFRELLAARGYSEGSSSSGPELDARFFREGQVVEVMFLHEREAGGVYWDDWRLAAETLEVRRGCLGEIRCPVVDPLLLLGCKEALLRDEDEPDERSKHGQDLARLRLLI